MYRILFRTNSHKTHGGGVASIIRDTLIAGIVQQNGAAPPFIVPGTAPKSFSSILLASFIPLIFILFLSIALMYTKIGYILYLYP